MMISEIGIQQAKLSIPDATAAQILHMPVEKYQLWRHQKIGWPLTDNQMTSLANALQAPKEWLFCAIPSETDDEWNYIWAKNAVQNKLASSYALNGKNKRQHNSNII